MKVLLWLIFFGLVIAAFIKKFSSAKSGIARPQRNVSADTKAEFMLRCGHCGVHFPSSDAVYQAAIPYCSEDHCGKPSLP